MTDQLSLFSTDSSVSPNPLKGHRKTCATCREEFYVPEGQHRSRAYCPTCKRYHDSTTNTLRLEYPIPDNHRCDCCGKSEDELVIHYGRTGNAISPWRLDHCHETREFRGWLCMNCNIGLGRFYDDPDLLTKAISYIQKDRP